MRSMTEGADGRTLGFRPFSPRRGQLPLAGKQGVAARHFLSRSKARLVSWRAVSIMLRLAS